VVSDIYPESGCRLPLPRREDMDADGQAVLDSLVAAKDSKVRGRAGPGVGLKGPMGIQLYSPKYAEAAHHLNYYLRFHSGIAGATRELAILVAAREMDHQFIWTVHEPMARCEGVDDAVIDLVRHRKDVAGLAEEQAVVILLGRESIGARKVSPETFERGNKLFGPRQLVDLVGLFSQYVAGAVFLNVFDMQLPDEQTPLLPASVSRRRVFTSCGRWSRRRKSP